MCGMKLLTTSTKAPQNIVDDFNGWFTVKILLQSNNISISRPRETPYSDSRCLLIMMTSSNGNIFRVTGLLCGEFTGHRWITRTKASQAELWCFFFIWACTSSWADNEDAGDLRRHGAHYDLIVLRKSMFVWHHCDGHRLSYACDYHLAWTYSQICTFI